MGVVLLQILQWILRIILFLLLLIVGLTVIVLIVPIRYRAEGEFLEKKPGIRGKITWFFYLIYMKFAYEEELQVEVRVFGFKVYDSIQEPKAAKESAKEKDTANAGNGPSDIGSEVGEKEERGSNISSENGKNSTRVSDPVKEKETTKVLKASEKNVEDSEQHTESEYSLADLEKEMKAAEQEEAKIADKMRQTYRTSAIEEDTKKVRENSLSDKMERIRQKIQDMIQKIQNIISKIQEGKLKAEHYLELWNRKETQVTFGRAKTKLGKIINAVLPKKWNIIGEIGFEDPCITGQLMGILGAMYPMIGSHVQITPDFEEKVMSIRGAVKGHIRLGTLLYQLISLVLHIHCFKFIKLVLDELGGSKKSKQQND